MHLVDEEGIFKCLIPFLQAHSLVWRPYCWSGHRFLVTRVPIIYDLVNHNLTKFEVEVS